MQNDEINTTTIDNSDDRARFIRENRKEPLVMALELMKEHAKVVISEDNLYIFNGRYYEILDDSAIERMIYEFVVKYGILDVWRSGKIRDIIRAIRSSSLVSKVKMNGDKDIICVNNGVVNIATRQITPHSDEFYTDSIVDVDFDKDNKSCPIFLYYLNDVFNGEEIEVQNAIELGGYIMDSSAKAEKMFFFDGDGGSGKSTLVNTYSLFFDERQISSLSLDTIARDSDFGREKLLTSRINFCGEQKKSYLDSEEIKKIVTGDLIDIKRKFKLSITIRPQCKLIVACNGMPKFNDYSEGILRRIFIICFKNKYKSKDEYEKIVNPEKKHVKLKDKSMFDKITTEKSAIFNLFLEGLVNLRNNDYDFKQSLTSFRAINGFKIDNDSTREFFEENYEYDEKTQTPVRTIYEHYKQWYRDNVQDTSSVKFRINELGRRIRDIFDVESNGRMRMVNQRDSSVEQSYCYPIRLKKELEQETPIVMDFSDIPEQKWFDKD